MINYYKSDVIALIMYINIKKNKELLSHFNRITVLFTKTYAEIITEQLAVRYEHERYSITV